MGRAGLKPRSVNLVFVTDGSPDQLAGLSYFCQRIVSPLARSELLRLAWLISTKSASELEISRLPLTDCWTRVHVDGDPSDRFYVKLGMSEAIERMRDEDAFLYFDADHFLVRPEVLGQRLRRTFDAERVIFSSEIGATPPALLRSLPAYENHFNSSFIFSSVETLRPCLRIWKDAYQYLDGKSAGRSREEIALSLACQWAGVVALECDPELQCSFARPCPSSALFHYGGTTPCAHLVKKDMAEAWTSNVPSRYQEIEARFLRTWFNPA